MKSVSPSMVWSRGGSSFWASSHLICWFYLKIGLTSDQPAGSAFCSHLNIVHTGELISLSDCCPLWSQLVIQLEKWGEFLGSCFHVWAVFNRSNFLSESYSLVDFFNLVEYVWLRIKRRFRKFFIRNQCLLVHIIRASCCSEGCLSVGPVSG